VFTCFLGFAAERKLLKSGSKFGAGDRSRTYTGVSPEDFESSASAIPPLRHVNILGQDSPVGNFITITADRKLSFGMKD
jgi:hypothetical protein